MLWQYSSVLVFLRSHGQSLINALVKADLVSHKYTTLAEQLKSFTAVLHFMFTATILDCCIQVGGAAPTF